jgi:hypothetical protein
MTKNLRHFFLIIFILANPIHSAIAQKNSFEFWPETDIWYKINSSWRLSAFVPITKYNESKYRDLNIFLQADYKWGTTRHSIYMRLTDASRMEKVKAWMVRGGFMEGWSLGENAGNYTEDMLFGEIHKRMPLKGNILISHRIRVDTRWVGEDDKFSYRFRYRAMLEKEYTTANSSLVPYVNAEFYWDSRYGNIAKTRLIGGATVNWGPRFAYEANLTYQYDTHYDSQNLYAFNVILHIFFEK